MVNIDIPYKVPLTNFVILELLLSFPLSLFLFGIFKGNANIYTSVFVTKMVFAAFSLLIIAAMIFYAYLIKINFRKWLRLTIDNETITFPKSNRDHSIVKLPLKSIKKAEVLETRRGRIKFIKIITDKDAYNILELNFTEKEFSIICNALIKKSNRCKACQSTNVDWHGNRGHCYNCETITPIYADEFDWSNAYNA